MSNRVAGRIVYLNGRAVIILLFKSVSSQNGMYGPTCSCKYVSRWENKPESSAFVIMRCSESTTSNRVMSVVVNVSHYVASVGTSCQWAFRIMYTIISFAVRHFRSSEWLASPPNQFVLENYLCEHEIFTIVRVLQQQFGLMAAKNVWAMIGCVIAELALQRCAL